MTQIVYIQVKAEDLRLGTMFCHWAVMNDGLYPEPRRILDIKKNGKKLEIYLDDQTIKQLTPKQLVIIQERR